MIKSDCSPLTGSPAKVLHSGFRQKVLRATFWSAVCLWGNRILTLLFFAILARLLGPDTFGLVALSGVYIGFLMVFQEQGFGHAVIQRKELHPDHLNTAFWMNVGLSLVLTLATVVGAPIIGWFFHEPRLSGVVRGLSPLFIIGALTSVQRALHFRNFRFRALAIAAIAGVSMGGVVGTLAALNGWGVWSLVFYQITTRACESAVIWWQSDWRPRPRFRRAHFRDMFGFGKYVVGGQLASFAYLYAPDMVIGFFLGSTAVGLFDVAYRCVRMVLEMISGVVAKVSLPTFARLQQEPEQGRALFLKATGQIALFSFPVFTAMAMLAPEIVVTVFGDKWAKVIPAMRALSLAGMIHSVCYLKRSMILAYGRPKWHFCLEWVTVAFTLVAVLVAVRAGIVAIAWAQVLVPLLSFPLLFLAASRLVHVRVVDYVWTVLPVFVAAIAMALAIGAVKVMLAGHVGATEVLIIGLSTGMCVYLAAIWVIDPGVLMHSRQYIQALFARGKCSESQASA
jgi:O-antigen/teichoic acid export membrane protein